LMVLLLLGLASSIAAPTPIRTDLAEEAQIHFTLGLQAYRDRQFPTALAHLLQSNRLAPNPNTAFNVALCYDRLAQPAQAWRFYAGSLQGDDRDKDTHAAMARLAPLVGRLSIDSDPPGARVFVQRQSLGERGETPLILALRPGRHRIIVERDGYQLVTIERELEAGDSDSIAVPLTPADVPREHGWVRSVVQYDDTVILVASPGGCQWLPDRGPLLATGGIPPVDPTPDPRWAPGSRVGAGADPDFSLDITVAGEDGIQTLRTPLSLPKPFFYLEDASAVRQWALAACPSVNDVDRSSAVDVLESLAKPLRRATVAVLGEMAGSQVADAALECTTGSCQGFIDAL